MRKLLCFLCLALLLIACNKSQQPGTSEIIKNEGEAQSELLQTYSKADSLYRQNIINDELFSNFIEKAIVFSKNYPENEIAAEMLYKAGIGSMILAKKASTLEIPDDDTREHYAQIGINIFNMIQNTYPDYEGVKYCYLNRAFIYDDILHKYLDAEYEYRDFLHKFPNDSICENIRMYLRVLGQDDEEIYARIEHQQEK